MSAGQALAAAVSDHVTPRCAHYDHCGGCALQHVDSDAQLRLKQQRLRDTFERVAGASPARWLPAIASAPWR